jgi:hypothetical protein
MPTVMICCLTSRSAIASSSVAASFRTAVPAGTEAWLQPAARVRRYHLKLVGQSRPFGADS